MKSSLNPIAILAVIAVLVGMGFWHFSSNAAENDQKENAKVQSQTQDKTAQNASSDLWLKRCQNGSDAANNQAKDLCEIYQRISVKESGQRLIEIAVGYDPATKAPRVAMIVPLGILVGNGVTYQVDDHNKQGAAIKTCNQGGCIAVAPLSKAVIKELQNGNVWTIGFVTAENKPVQIKISLKGFAKALKSIRI